MVTAQVLLIHELRNLVQPDFTIEVLHVPYSSSSPKLSVQPPQLFVTRTLTSVSPGP